jgi:hypothetical protein
MAVHFPRPPSPIGPRPSTLDPQPPCHLGALQKTPSSMQDDNQSPVTFGSRVDALAHLSVHFPHSERLSESGVPLHLSRREASKYCGKLAWRIVGCVTISWPRCLLDWRRWSGRADDAILSQIGCSIGKPTLHYSTAAADSEALPGLDEKELA